MATADALIEMDRRGELTGQRKQMFDLAVERGIIRIPKTTVSRGAAANRGFFDQAMLNVMNVAPALGELAGQGIAGASAAINAPVRAAGNVLEGRPANITGEFTEGRERLLNTFPVPQLRNIPRANQESVEMLRAVGGSPGVEQDTISEALAGNAPGVRERFQRNLQLSRDVRAESEEQFPGTVQAGEVGADVLALASARAPVARGRVPGMRQERLSAIEKAKNDLPLEVREKLNDVVTDKLVPAIAGVGPRAKRLAGKTSEAAIEGAFVAALNDADIETSAGLAAGTQLAASPFLFIGEQALKRPLASGIATAIIATSMFQAIAPGEQDIFEAKDFAVQKAVAALGLGLLSGLMGSGRLRGPVAERAPVLIDSLTSVPRGAVQSLLQDFFAQKKQGNDLPMQVAERLSRNPQAFNRNVTSSLERAMMSGKEGAFTREVERLMRESKSFREAMSN